MKRKHLYGILAAVVLLPALCIMAMPSSTRATFFTEFEHRTKSMLGYSADPIVGADGSQGLRIEHPEEYGPGAHGDSENESPTSEQETTETSTTEE